MGFPKIPNISKNSTRANGVRKETECRQNPKGENEDDELNPTITRSD